MENIKPADKAPELKSDKYNANWKPDDNLSHEQKEPLPLQTKANEPAEKSAEKSAEQRLYPTFRCVSSENRTVELHALYNLKVPDISRAALAAVCFLCVGFVFISSIPLWPTDLWSHLSFGQWTAENGRLPTVDPFSCCDPQPIKTQAWWGSQLVGYYCWKALGPDGLILLHSFFLVLTAGFVILATWANGTKSVLNSCAALIFYLLGGSILLIIRPQIAGMAAFAWTLYCAYWLRRSWIPILTLIPTFVLWANCHGSFVMGLGLLGIFALGDSLQAIGQNRKQLFTDQSPLFQLTFWRTWAAIGICTAAACVNPSGINLLLDVVRFSKSQGLDNATEWMPLSWNNAPFVLTAVVLSMAVAIPTLCATLLGYGRRRANLTDWLLLTIFLALAWLKLRLAIWYAIAFPVVLLPILGGFWSNDGEAGEDGNEAGNDDDSEVEDDACRQPSPAEVIPFKLFVALAIVFVSLMSSPAFLGLFFNFRTLPQQIGKQMPLKIAEYVEKNPISGSFVASEEWSDYLVFCSHGRMKPLSYGYFHLIPDQRMAEATTIFFAQPGWESLVDRLGIDYLVIQNRGLKRNAQILHPMIQSGKWELVLVDNPQNITEALLRRKK